MFKAHTKTPDKNNKLKVGDKVEILRDSIEWHAKHIVFLYGRYTNEHPKQTEIEFGVQDFDTISGWLKLYSSNKPLYAKVTGYGGTDYDKKTHKKALKNMKVVHITYKLPGCKQYNTTYYSERDLKKVK